MYEEDWINIALGVVASIAALFFVGMQGYLCLKYPFEWFTGFVSLLVTCLCIWILHYRM